MDSAAATYVGGATCVACHQSESSAWAGSHHDRAMEEPTEQTVLGDFDDATFTAYGVTTTFYREGEAFMVRTEGPEGDLQDYPVAYTFGVDPLQQYLIAFPGGRYQALSISWDSRPESEGGQRWFHLYPDERIGPDDPLHWTRRSQNWNYMCASCHSTDLRKNYDQASGEYATSWSDVDVSCEACHGPASVHLAVAASVAEGAETPASWGFEHQLADPGRAWRIAPGEVNASRVTPRASDREIQTCAHCHARRAEITNGRDPTQHVLDNDLVSLLQDGLYHADGQILDEVYVYGSFVQSRMYQAGVTCSDCHEPHSLELRAEGNALCGQCHLPTAYDTPEHHFHEQGSESAQCVNCHMPSKTYMVVDPRRDHSMRIPRPDLTADIGTPNACSGCHADQPVEWAVGAVERWWGLPEDAHYGQTLHAGRLGAPGSGPRLAQLAADTTRPGIVRGSALELMARTSTGPDPSAVGNALRDGDPLVRLGAVRALEALPPDAMVALGVPALEDSILSVRIEAARILAAVPRTMVPAAQLSAIDAAVQEYERVQIVNADHPSSAANLGNLYAIRGQFEASEAWYRAAIELDPDFLPPYLNLADLYRARGSDLQGEQLLRDARQRFPDLPQLDHALGLLLVRQGETAEATELLRRAAEGQPENPRFAFVYGVALNSAGASVEALEVLAAAHELHPYDRDLLWGLASFHRDAGDIDSAIEYAERWVEVAPRDPEAQQLLVQLRGPRGAG